MKKSVVFLQTDCLHDFGPDIAQLTPDTLAKLTPEQVIGIKQQLTIAMTRLQKLKQSIGKLTSEEIAMLKPEVLSSAELQQIGNLVLKMASLTDEDLKKLTPEEMKTLPTDYHLGTGFVVLLTDPRLPAPPGEKGEFGFGYLVTNRHVVQPGVEDGKPCRVLNHSVLLNRRGDSPNGVSHTESVIITDAAWHFSTDDSVDLAVVPFSAPADTYDYVRIPVDFFVTQEMVEKKQVVEGEPVLFSGLFIQSFQQVHTLEPIVRSGTLAMVPNEAMETTLHKLGRVYLAEVHAFGGNSGSPVFVDTAKFTGPIGYAYKLLGVISGEILESSDFIMHVTTSYKANLAVNSDISVVVPAARLRVSLMIRLYKRCAINTFHMHRDNRGPSCTLSFAVQAGGPLKPGVGLSGDVLRPHMFALLENVPNLVYERSPRFASRTCLPAICLDVPTPPFITIAQ
jgi:hypothetical protein